MVFLDYTTKNHYKEILEEHNTNKADANKHLNTLCEINMPTPLFIEVVNKLEGKFNNNLKEFFEKWEDLSEKKCHEIAEDLLKEFESENSNKTDDFAYVMEYLTDIMKFIEENIEHYQRFKVIFPLIVETFLERLRGSYTSYRNKTDIEINNLKNKNSLLESQLDHHKKMHEETVEMYEDEISKLKEKVSNQKLDVLILIFTDNSLKINYTRRREVLIE